MIIVQWFNEKVIAAHYKRAATTIAFLWMGSIVGAALAFLTQVIIARQLGPADFGNFSAAFAAVALCSPLAGFGVAQYWLKIFGEEGLGAKRWLPASLNLVGLSTLTAMVFLACWAVYGPHDEDMRAVLLVLSIYVIGQVSIELVSGKLQLEERYLALALWQLTPHLARFVAILILVYIFSQLITSVSVVLVYAVIAGILAVIGAIQLLSMSKGRFYFRKHGQKTSLIASETPGLAAAISQAWPFALAGLFHLIYFQSDVILVKYMTGSKDAGIYNVAFTVLVVVLFLPNIIYQKFLLPKVHRWATHDHIRIYYVYRQGNMMMLVLGLMAMVAIWAIAPTLIPILFGHEYSDAVSLLNILAICAPLVFVASNTGVILVTKKNIKKKVQYMGVVATLNIVLNLLLIPVYGAAGAAFATVISNIVLVVVYRNAAQNVLNVRGKKTA